MRKLQPYINMIQVIEMTDQEKYDMYMKLKKSELIKMLIEANKHIERMSFPLKVESVPDLTPDVCKSCPNNKPGEFNVCHCTLPYFDNPVTCSI